MKVDLLYILQIQFQQKVTWDSSVIVVQFPPPPEMCHLTKWALIKVLLGWNKGKIKFGASE